MTEKYTMGVEVGFKSKKQPAPIEVKNTQSSASELPADSPFCIAILGDFSGRDSSGHDSNVQGNNEADAPRPLKNRRFIEIDRDNIEQVMKGFDIKLNIQLADAQTVSLGISELDDFHPDELYDKLDSFAQLRSLRRRLKNNKTFDEAVAEMQAWISVDEASAAKHEVNLSEQATAADINNDISNENLLDNILQSNQESANQPSPQAKQINQLIKSIVAPYVEAAADPRQEEMMAVLDKATTQHMRDILHSELFQQLESAWLSLYFLVSRLETSAKLKLYILDVSKQEIMEDLAVDDLQTSALYKRFCDLPAGDTPWSLLVGNYTFNDTIEDVLALGSMATLAQAANAPFISAANETLAGCASFASTPEHEDWQYASNPGVLNAWEILRASSVAPYIGLALPRFLLRLPYGKKSKPIETFSFEEMPDELTAQQTHNNYLWGNAAILKAQLLARGFLQSGWKLQPGEVQQTEKLPLHYYQDDGETLCKPAAEILLTEKGGEKLTSQGLMPLWSVKNMDVIRSSDFRSISVNAEKLQGRWC